MAIATREPAYRPDEPRSVLSFIAPPIEIDGDSIVFHPSRMTTGEFYMAVLKGKPFLYQKIADAEVQVYGLAE